MSLRCRADLQNLTNWSKPCGACNICLPQSALKYPFERDLVTSKMLVAELKTYISTSTGLICSDTGTYKNPDIVITDKMGKLIARIEAKLLEGKAFMKAAQILKDPLFPKETLVVDEPKLKSYFECKQRDLNNYKRNVSLFVVWKYDRPCADVGGICIYQEADVLKRIYEQKGASRKYTRITGQGDFIDGQKIGIVDKFHFSITECLPIEQLPADILKLSN